jgi:hypothetical protein
VSQIVVFPFSKIGTASAGVGAAGVGSVRILRFTSFLAAALVSTLVFADDDARAARMVAELGLVEAAAPIRESPGWKKPRRVIVREATPQRLAWLQEAAPGVDLVPVWTPAEAVARARDADAVIGYCSAEILEAGANIRWIQWYFAGIEGCLAALGDRAHTLLITNMQKVAAPVMAEHVTAMMLAFARGLHTYVQAQSRGEWRPDLVPPELAARPDAVRGGTRRYRHGSRAARERSRDARYRNQGLRSTGATVREPSGKP